jgi:hypothetical protein
MLHAGRHRGLERGEVGHGVVGGHDDHDAVFVGSRNGERRHRECRRRVPARGLENETCSLAAHAQLFRCREAMFLVAHHDDPLRERIPRIERIEPACRGLQQRVVAKQSDQLLRILLARHGPQARAGAAREYHRMDLQLHAGRSGHTSAGASRRRNYRMRHIVLLTQDRRSVRAVVARRK